MFSLKGIVRFGNQSDVRNQRIFPLTLKFRIVKLYMLATMVSCFSVTIALALAHLFLAAFHWLNIAKKMFQLL